VSGERKLRFQLNWLNRWKWLSYSPSQDGAFCKYCALFAPEVGAGRGHQRLGRLVVTSFNKWKDAVESFNAHESTDYHKSCVVAADAFMSVACTKQDSVALQLDKNRKLQVEENQRKIVPIIETVLFCGRQGLALRGHSDSGRIDSLELPVVNDGNFRALLRYRASGGDVALADHLQNSGRNAMYISPQIQNEIISACNSLIVSDLVKKINSAQCFSVLADETADIAGVEQLSLCARHLDAATGRVREDFLQFVPIYDVTGKGLATVIIDGLTKLGLNLQYLRGQGYDGAAAMSGRISGVQTHIRQTHPLAVYVHCSSHSLNLAISDACTVPAIRNCFGTIGAVYSFLNTPKRNHVLKACVEHIIPSSARSRLTAMCPTRWVERHDSVHIFKELLHPVNDCLETIAQWPDRDSSAGASRLLCSIRQPEFILALHVAARIFALTLPLCRELQRESIDLAVALHMAAEVRTIVQGIRDNVDDEFHQMYTTASDLCAVIGVDIVMPRITNRQTNRCNIAADNAEDYFRAAVCVPFVDNFLTQLHERFLAHNQLLRNFMCLLPTTPSSLHCSNSDRRDILQLADMYNEDINCTADTAAAELQLWLRHLAALPDGKKPMNAVDAFYMCDGRTFPAIKKLLQIMATLPVTTCSSERSFSTLRRLKTYLRNTTGDDRLNGLALLNIHRDVRIDISQVITELCAAPRRLPFQLS